MCSFDIHPTWSSRGTFHEVLRSTRAPTQVMLLLKIKHNMYIKVLEDIIICFFLKLYSIFPFARQHQISRSSDNGFDNFQVNKISSNTICTQVIPVNSLLLCLKQNNKTQYALSLGTVYSNDLHNMCTLVSN